MGGWVVTISSVVGGYWVIDVTREHALFSVGEGFVDASNSSNKSPEGASRVVLRALLKAPSLTPLFSVPKTF